LDEYCAGLAVNRWVEVLRFSGIGFYIAGCIVLGVVLGVWLDRKVDISPLFTLLGLGLGLFAAFFGTYRMLLLTLWEGRGKRKGDS
jgi:ATP synthase protein I